MSEQFPFPLISVLLPWQGSNYSRDFSHFFASFSSWDDTASTTTMDLDIPVPDCPVLRQLGDRGVNEQS